MARGVVLRMLLAGAAVASMVSTTHADDSASQPEGLYICLQNANMTGSVWHPVECSRFAVIEDQIADRASQPVVHFDHIGPNVTGGTNIWWKVDFSMVEG
jgi:hypothetical protein